MFIKHPSKNTEYAPEFEETYKPKQPKSNGIQSCEITMGRVQTERPEDCALRNPTLRMK